MKYFSGIYFILLILLSFTAWSEEGDEPQKSLVSEEKQEEVQETKYVTDKLRLSLYKQADSGSGTIKLLVSGDKLDVLGRKGPYSRVRTQQGETGWVKNGFLVSIPTASNRLQDMEKQIERLKADLEKYSNSKNVVKQYEDRLKQLQQEKQILAAELEKNQQENDSLLQQKSVLAAELERLQNRDNSLDPQMVLQIVMQYWYVLFAIILMMFALGIIIGWKMIEARINRRFQGVKVL